MFDMKKFGDYIVEKRKQKSLTQAELADILGLSHQAVSKWERGEAIPEVSKIDDVARALGTSRDEILAAMYDESEKPESVLSDTDSEYYSLADKTDVSVIYSLAPRMSPEALKVAIDTVIASSGIDAASILFKFADGEYLNSVAKIALENGNMKYAKYADEDGLHQYVIRAVVRADSLPIGHTSDGEPYGEATEHYMTAAALLSYCKDEEFVTEMFDHIVERVGTWNVMKKSVGLYPDSVIEDEATRFMIENGPNAFSGWWDNLGKRNMARALLGYADHFDNNAKAWSDIAQVYQNVDSSIMESGIKARLNTVDPEVFRPVVKWLSASVRSELEKLGIVVEPEEKHRAFDFPFWRFNFNGNPDVLDYLAHALGDLADKFGDIEDRFGDIEDKIDDLENNLADIEDRIDNL